MWAAVALALLAAGCSTPPPTPGPTEVTAATADGTSYFDPGDFQGKVGIPVRFASLSGNHTLDFSVGDAPVFGIDHAHHPLPAGSRAQVTFSARGVYHYFCRNHSSLEPDGSRSGMTGTLYIS